MKKTFIVSSGNIRIVCDSRIDAVKVVNDILKDSVTPLINRIEITVLSNKIFNL